MGTTCKPSGKATRLAMRGTTGVGALENEEE